jgi:hypothetical protein
MRTRLRTFAVSAGAVILCTLVPATSVQAATEVPVLTTPAGEFQPARGPNHLAWEENSKAQPKHFDVFLQGEAGPAIKVNGGRSNAATGGIDGHRLVYQQFRRGRSDLFLYDIESGGRSKLPKVVNTRRWEYWPSLSGSWLLFARLKVKNETRRLVLYNLESGERRVLDRTRGKNAFIGPGQVNGDYAVWSTCRAICNVFRYHILTGEKVLISNPGVYQRAPSVTPGGTVYLSRGGKACGDGVSLVRVAADGSEETLVELPEALDIKDTYVHTEPNGSVEVYFDRIGCGRPTAGDIFKVRDPLLVSLSVTVEGAGSGTVSSSPPGITCGVDCSEDFELGSTVTLTPQASPGSAFGGWGGDCTGTGACVVSMDGVRSVTATFLPLGSITIIKDAVPPSSQPFIFDHTLGGLDFLLVDDGFGTEDTITFSGKDPGTYTVSEDPDPAGWRLTDITCTGGGPDTSDAGRTATIGLDPNEVIVCTFTNTEEGSIRIVKDAEPDAAQDFEFDPGATLDAGPNFLLDDDQDPARSTQKQYLDLLPGTYTVREVNIPAAWPLSSLSCVGGGGNTTTALETATATIGLDPGEDVVCTFTDAGQGSITIVKDAIEDDPQDFSFSTTGGLSPSAFTLDDDADGTLADQRVFLGVPAGVYTVSEDPDPAGWQLTDIACTGGGLNTSHAGRTATVGLDPGEAVTCTFENTEEGSITIVQDVVGSGPVGQDFEFDPSDGLQLANFFLDDDADPTLSNTRDFTDLLSGTYTVTQVDSPEPFPLQSVNCNGGGPNTTTSPGEGLATVGLDPGELVVCTFQNGTAD